MKLDVSINTVKECVWIYGDVFSGACTSPEELPSFSEEVSFIMVATTRAKITLQFAQLFVLMFGFCCVGMAQVATGTIMGRITDPSGALLPESSVTLTKPDTGLVLRATSNSAGIYTFGSLQTGAYRVEASHDGFTRTQVEATLAVGQTLQLDLSLSVGSSAQTLTVQANESTELHTENPTLSYVVGAQQVNNLPMNGRNVYGLAALSPGITPGGSFGVGLSTTRGALVAAGTNNFEANGGIAGSNEVLLDGVPIALCCQGQPAVTPTAEVIDQFSVITSVPPARFGRTSGGIMNLVTKTGTNRLSGDLYEYLRNDQLDAADYFQKRSGVYPIPGRNDFRAPHRFNQFGGLVSGPVYIPKVYRGIDKTFFTFSYEGVRNVNSGFVTTSVPTVLMRQGVFTEAPAPIYDPHNITSAGASYTRSPLPAACGPNGCYDAGRYIPTIDPVAQKLLSFYPLPNAPGSSDNYSYSQSVTTTDNQFNFRVDHNFSSSQRIYVRGTRGVDDYHQNDLFNQPDGPNANDQQLLAYLFAIGHTWVVSPSLLLQFNYGFAYQQNHQIPQNFTGFQAGDYGFSSNFTSEQQVAGLPLMNISDLVSLGNAANPNSFVHYTHFLMASATWQKGNHSLGFGYDGRIILENEQTLNNPLGTFTFNTTLTNGPNPNAAVPGGQAQFDAFAAFLLGTPATTTLTRQQTVAFSQWYNAIYAQDDWRIRPNLTLNLGLRYEVETGPLERYNRWADLSLDIANPVSTPAFPIQGGALYMGVDGNPSRLWKTYYDKFSPRIGFAYSATPTTVARGGFGILYLPTSQRVYSAGTLGYSQVTQNVYTSISNPTTTTADPFPGGVSLPIGSAAGVQAANGSTASGLPYTNPMAYEEQWNFGVEQQVSKGVVLAINYAGTHGVKLPINTRMNDLPPQDWGAPGDQSQVSYLQASVANPFFNNPYAGSLNKAATVQRSQLLVAYPQYTSNTALANSTFSLQQNDIGSASYNAIQVSLRFQPSKSLTGGAIYTWSKLLGNVIDITTSAFNPTGTPSIQSFYFLKNERSNLATDVPHRVVGNVNYSLPFGKGQQFGNSIPKWADEIVGGWNLNAIVSVQSGFPLSITQTGGAAFSPTRPTLLSGARPLTGGATSDRLQGYFNKAAFRLSQSFELGNLPRSAALLRGPLTFQNDVSAIKNFPIHDSLSLQFRAEAFNLLNKEQFGLPNTSFNSTNFGVIAASGGLPRNVQLALKLFY